MWIDNNKGFKISAQCYSQSVQRKNLCDLEKICHGILKVLDCLDDALFVVFCFLVNVRITLRVNSLGLCFPVQYLLALWRIGVQPVSLLILYP